MVSFEDKHAFPCWKHKWSALRRAVCAYWPLRGTGIAKLLWFLVGDHELAWKALTVLEMSLSVVTSALASCPGFARIHSSPTRLLHQEFRPAWGTASHVEVNRVFVQL